MSFVAEGTAVGAGVKWLATLPAEASLGSLARLEARMDIRHVGVNEIEPDGRSPSLSASADRHPRGEQVLEEIRGSLVACGQVRCERAHDDVVDRPGEA